VKTQFKLNELAAKITQEQASKKDYLANTEQVKALPNGEIELKDIGLFKVNNNAHSQLSARLNIPKKYYDKMTVEAPELWANNVNHWLSNNPEQRLIRTLDGKVRAFLSDRYRVLDNVDLLEAVLPTLMERDDLSIESLALTENKLYLKAFFTNLNAEVTSSPRVNDFVNAGLCISNSEVGAGSLSVSPMLNFLFCSNGQYSDRSTKKYHTGVKNSVVNGSEITTFLTDATKQARDRATFMELNDLVKSCMNIEFLNDEIAKIEGLTSQKIDGEIIEVVKSTSKLFGFSEEQNTGILNHLIKGGDLSRYGLMNAVTRTSQDINCYEQADMMEKVGGKIVTLSNHDWKTLSTAVA